MTQLQKILLLMLAAGVFAASFARQPLTWEAMFTSARISNPALSPDGSWIAYQLSRYQANANSSNSDIYLISSDGSRQRQLTFRDGSESSPQWSPDGKQLAFISSRDGSPQVYLLAIAGGEARKATSIATGVSSYLWSPDGKQMAITTDLYPETDSPEATQEVAAMRRKANPSSARVYNQLLYRHWNSWREGVFSQVLVVDLASGAAVKVTPGSSDVPPISLGSSHDIAWSPDGKQLCFVQNPDQRIATSTNNDLFLVNREGGSAVAVTSNKGNDNGPVWSPDGTAIAYYSMARAGFEADEQDLMIYDIKTKQHRNLTGTLNRSVSQAVWSPDSRKLYIIVPHHGRHRLYEVERQSGKRRLLLDKQYISKLNMSPDGKFLIMLHQTSRHPWEVSRLDLANKKLRPLTRHNQQHLADTEMMPLEDYWFSGAKGDSVHLMLIKPPGFDPSKRYPVVNLIHGGPQGAWGDDFHFRWNSQLFAAPGYVVLMINFHGSSGYGQEFCDAVSKDWGGAPYEDIIAGTRWAIENFDFIDGERIGAAGASYGGFMINWIAGHNPDHLFKTLVCHAGLFEQVSFFGATEELWFPSWEFNKPYWEDPSLYQKWNPANFVENFSTPMMVVHGEQDFRVPYSQGLQLYTALQMKGVESRLLIFPDEDHFIRKSLNARYWWEQVHGWLGNYLQPEGQNSDGKSATEPANGL